LRDDIVSKLFESNTRISQKKNKNFLYPLVDVLLLSIIAVFHGAETYEEIADFGSSKATLLERFVRFPHGTPSHDTI
jgi:hypothetical protein